MAKFKVSKSVKSFGAGPAKAKAGDFGAGATNFELADNHDNSFDVFGVTAAGNRADISGLATLAVTSSDPAMARWARSRSICRARSSRGRWPA